MSAAVFELRWNRLLRLREEGYEEISDLLGRQGSLGPLVRTGLLRRREQDTEFQRYNGYVPTDKGLGYLLHIPEKELVLVRPDKSAGLQQVLRKDPVPDAPFKATYAEPTAPQFEAVQRLREQAGHDVWRAQRAEHLHKHLLQGYMDIRAFTRRTGIGEGALLNLGLCRHRVERPHERALPLSVTEEGAKYLHIPDPWELLLVKPGMELPLFAACDPGKAEYWCGLP